MQPRGLRDSSNSKLNAKAREASGVQRKRSRSEIVDEPVDIVMENEEVPEKRILFPGRQPRRPMMRIDFNRLPLPNPNHGQSDVSGVMHKEMRLQELLYAPNPDYLRHQRQLNAKMRAVLIDWMNEVAQEYGLKRETLHCSINFIDRYLSNELDPVPKNELQLIGVTSLWVASKMVEILPPPVGDFAAATDGGCTVSQMLNTESYLVQILDWKLVPCTAFGFANYYLQALATNARKALDPEFAQRVETQKAWMVISVVPANQMNRVMEVVDYAMLDIDSLCFPPSMIAASAIMCLVEKDKESIFSVRNVEEATQYSKKDLADCIEWFSFAIALPPAPSHSFRQHVLTSTPHQELHTIQRHNRRAIAQFKDEVYPIRSVSRHPAAERYRLHPRHLREENESDEDVELTAIAKTRPHPGLVAVTGQLQDPQRAFSPMSNISMQLENTSLGQAAATGNGSPQSASPQRTIKFQDKPS